MDCGWIDDGCWAVDRLMVDGLWRDGQMDQWMDDGWMDNGKKEENLRSPFPCILPSCRPSLTLSPGGEHLPCAMEAETPNHSLGSAPCFFYLVPAVSVFNWFSQLHSCPFLSPHPEAVSLPSPSLSLACVSITPRLGVLNLGEGHPCSSLSTLAYSLVSPRDMHPDPRHTEPRVPPAGLHPLLL